MSKLRSGKKETTPTSAGDDHFMTVAEAAQLFQRPDRHNDRDTGPFHYFLGLSADSEYRPILLVEPTATDWWLIDGIHRAAALFAARSTAGLYELRLLVFVLPRPLRWAWGRGRTLEPCGRRQRMSALASARCRQRVVLMS